MIAIAFAQRGNIPHIDLKDRNVLGSSPLHPFLLGVLLSELASGSSSKAVVLGQVDLPRGAMRICSWVRQYRQISCLFSFSACLSSSVCGAWTAAGCRTASSVTWGFESSVGVTVSWGSGVAEADLSDSEGSESRVLALVEGAVTGLVTRAWDPNDRVAWDPVVLFPARRRGGIVKVECECVGGIKLSGYKE